MRCSAPRWWILTDGLNLTRQQIAELLDQLVKDVKRLRADMDKLRDEMPRKVKGR